MQRKLLFLACFFMGAGSFAQQYPFVHYTPRDGLVSNRVKSIYQDSKGKIYFVTQSGLSVYDGSRFINYTSEDGLQSDVVNFVMEMGEDSVWVITNTTGINCLVKGQLRILELKNPATPVINFLCRDEKGNLYAAADEGLFLFQQDSFIRLPFEDSFGKDVNQYIVSLIPAGDYLLCLREPNLNGARVLYLYNYSDREIVSQTNKINILSIAKAKDGRIWLTTDKGVMELNNARLAKGEISLQELPYVYKDLSNKIGYIFFDNANNCWLVQGTGSLFKYDKNGHSTEYTTSSGLGMNTISFVFNDKENIIWLASEGGGVDKLTHTNISLTEQPFGFSQPSSLCLSATGNEMLLYSNREGRLVRFTGTTTKEMSPVAGAAEINQVVETSKGTFGIGSNKIFRLRKKGASWHPELLFRDTSLNHFGNTAIDAHGNLLITGEKYLTAVLENNVFQMPVHYLSDQVAADNKGNIWLANRKEEMVHVTTHPENAFAYLKQQAIYTKELKDLAPRSIIVDTIGRIWVGTRFKGIFVFTRENENLNLAFHLTSKTGLSENFVSYLVCDADNVIWACTPSGLDKINIKNGIPVIENLTRQNNVYENVFKVVIDKNKTAWALTSGRLIKITPETRDTSGYVPQLMVTQMRTGAAAINELSKHTFTYKQNNPSFYFAAPSFFDEKEIRYSYRLEGSGSKEWSELSNNAAVSFVDLKPGNYTLNLKAVFPAGRYPDQTIQYFFSITPPWWQTWWFRLAIGIFAIGMLVTVIRLYYLGKLERQKTILEKKQAIEKERTRIATDMHDDLGAGLSRIKFLSETIGIKKQKEQSIEDEISSIRNYSHEMIDKMGEIVWALNEKNDSLNDLLSYTRSYAVEYLMQNGIRCTVEMADEFPTVFVTGEFRRNIYLAVKEALHNVVKHAAAGQVCISFRVHRQLEITIKDDGRGFDPNRNRPHSNGLINMKKRMQDIGGTFEINNAQGTYVHLSAPLTL